MNMKAYGLFVIASLALVSTCFAAYDQQEHGEAIILRMHNASEGAAPKQLMVTPGSPLFALTGLLKLQWPAMRLVIVDEEAADSQGHLSQEVVQAESFLIDLMLQGIYTLEVQVPQEGQENVWVGVAYIDLPRLVVDTLNVEAGPHDLQPVQDEVRCCDPCDAIVSRPAGRCCLSVVVMGVAAVMIWSIWDHYAHAP